MKRCDNKKSVQAVFQFLITVIREPEGFINDQKLLSALTSQGRFYRTDIEGYNIHGLSLNTVKKIANENVDGGFEALDRLRIRVLEELVSHNALANKSNKITKTGLTKRVKELEQKLLQSDQDKLLLTRLLMKSLAQAKNYVLHQNGQVVVSICEREQRDILNMLSLLQLPLVQTEHPNEE